MTQRQFVSRMATAIALLGLAVAAVRFMWAAADVLVLLLISAILAAGFAPLLELVEGPNSTTNSKTALDA